MSFSSSRYLVAIVSVVALAGLARSQAPSSLPPAPSLQSTSLPRTCQDQRQGSEKIAAILEIIRNHPTTGAFNTLGALYAQRDFPACAVAAFEAALRLDSRNWEAHYNLGIARMNSGDMAHAKNEFRAAIHEKPDSASSHGSQRGTHSDRKSTRLNSSHVKISYAVFCLKKKKKKNNIGSIRESYSD